MLTRSRKAPDFPFEPTIIQAKLLDQVLVGLIYLHGFLCVQIAI